MTDTLSILIADDDDGHVTLVRRNMKRAGLDVEEPFRQQRAQHLAADLERGRASWDDVNRAARRCVVPPFREGGQAQYIERPIPAAAGTGTEPTRAWALR